MKGYLNNCKRKQSTNLSTVTVDKEIRENSYACLDNQFLCLCYIIRIGSISTTL